jgi:folate-binding protein YgfZ
MSDLAHAIHLARTGALLRLRDDLALIAAAGRDRKTWLNGLVTCDLAKLGAGQGAFGLAVSKTGKLRAELLIGLGAERLYVAAPKDRAEDLYGELDRHLIMEQVELTQEPGLAAIEVVGPGAALLLDAARAAGAELAVPLDTTGLGGALIASARTNCDALLSALLTAGGDGVALGDEAAFEALRLELGLGRFGVDYGDASYPQEAGLERVAVSFEKGCYLGQEAVFMLQVRGHVKQRLIPLEIAGNEGVPVGTAVLVDGSPVGAVSSCGISPVSQQVLALATVKYAHAEPGTALTVMGRAAHVRVPSR